MISIVRKSLWREKGRKGWQKRKTRETETFVLTLYAFLFFRYDVWRKGEKIRRIMKLVIHPLQVLPWMCLQSPLMSKVVQTFTMTQFKRWTRGGRNFNYFLYGVSIKAINFTCWEKEKGKVFLHAKHLLTPTNKSSFWMLNTYQSDLEMTHKNLHAHFKHHMKWLRAFFHNEFPYYQRKKFVLPLLFIRRCFLASFRLFWELIKSVERKLMTVVWWRKYCMH
jgi:hypothetical protein